MRYYHVYVQKSMFVGYNKDGYPIAEWLPKEYLGWVLGTRELYECFHRKFMWQYNAKPVLSSKYGRVIWDGWTEHPPDRYMIVDDRGYIRSYWELTQKYYKRKTYPHRTRPYQSRSSAHIMQTKRNDLSPQEIREIRDKYGIVFQPLKKNETISSSDYYDFCIGSAKARSWKDQSKRKHQYKPV